jgi:predicted DNA binding protein
MMLTKIKISLKENIVSSLASDKGARINVIRCKANDRIGGLSILRIESETETSEEDIIDWFRKFDGCSVLSIISTSHGRHLVTVRNTRCTLCKALSNSDCFLESGSSTEGESLIWRVFSPSNSSTKSMIEGLRQEGCKVELLSVKKAVSSFELTQVQDEAIKTAFSMGFYDIPKRVTLEELAARSGVSKATLNIILRRAQRKILSEHLGK